MQGKGILKLFLILVSVVCLLQFIFMIPTSKVERDADDYAKKVAAVGKTDEEKQVMEKAARVEYLDSMSSEQVFSIPLLKKFSYEDLKKRQLALGLDLKGGMSNVLRVDLKDFLVSLSGNSKDPDFLSALKKAEDLQKTSQTDFVRLFAQEFSKSGKKLAAIFASNPSLKDKLNFESTDAQVVNVLREKADETVSLTFKRLKDRIDKFGVTQPNVSLDKARDLIVVELPGVDNKERARNLLQASAKLEFWDVYRVSDPGVIDLFKTIDQKLAKTDKGDTSTAQLTKKDSTWTPTYDSLGNVVDSTLNVVDVPLDQAGAGPLTSILTLNMPSQQGMIAQMCVIGVADRNKKNIINEYFEREDIKKLIPADMLLRWSAYPVKDPKTFKRTSKYELYALKKKRGSDQAPLEGDRVISATSHPDPVTGQVAVSLKMDNQGAKIWGEMTTRAAQDNHREIAIVLDDEVVSSPRVNDPITSGDSQISGSFTVEEGQDLANILQIGKLPAKTKIISESFVGPSLGKENINKSLISLIIGLIAIVLIMVIYYSSAGIISVISLIVNSFFIFGALASFGNVLTLPGIAGIILTMSLAVDINVIIFERIKEEIRAGKDTKTSVVEGFRHAMSAVIDANITTLLITFVMIYYGLGPIKGFAVTLTIGVFSSVITAVLLSRLIIDSRLNKGKDIKFITAFSDKFHLDDITFNWVGFRKKTYLISGLLIVAGIVSFFVRGFELGVDLKGGYSYNIQFDPSTKVEVDNLKNELTTVFNAVPIVKSIDTKNTYNVTTSYLIEEIGEDANTKVADKLFEGVNKYIGGKLDKAQFENTDGKGTHIVSAAKVGPTVADDIFSSSFKSFAIALLLTFIYIFARYNNWQYSVAAIISLIHDGLIILVFFTLLHGILPFSLEIDQAFIAAFLTILGYSMNDTVIVFDRLREFLNTYTNKSRTEIINAAINSTLNRTIITSAITLVVCLILFIFGGDSIRGFAFALVVGVIIGTYSSIFVATPVMYDMTQGEKGLKRKTTTTTEETKPAAKVS